MTNRYDQAARILNEAERVLVLSGAGMSADSGVPTFRGGDGLWKSFRPEDLATPEAFDAAPERVWEWYSWRQHVIHECIPHAGYRALAKWVRSRSGVRIVTQNVDGLHARARREIDSMVVRRRDSPSIGIESEDDLLELHGSLFRVRCTSCCAVFPLSTPMSCAESVLPHCSSCGAALRPDVVWFGEALADEVLERAIEGADEADVCLVVGTSGMVHPAAGLPMRTFENGGTVIEVNIERTRISNWAHLIVTDRAVEALPRILESDPAIVPSLGSR